MYSGYKGFRSEQPRDIRLKSSAMPATLRGSLFYIIFLVAGTDGASTSAEPTPTTTITTPTSCEWKGQLYDLDTVFSPPGEPCASCYCYETGTADCLYASCAPAICPNPVDTPCCRYCPRGNACSGKEGDEIPNGQSRTYPDGSQCTCIIPQSAFFEYRGEAVIAQCIAPEPSTSSTLGTDVIPTEPTGCEWEGQLYEANSAFQPDPCTYCTCEGNEPQCAIGDCFFVPCPNPVHDPTQCCPVCPNGPACRGRDGDEIPDGETREYPDGTQCTCEISEGNWYDNEDYLSAKCILVSVTPDAITVA